MDGAVPEAPPGAQHAASPNLQPNPQAALVAPYALHFPDALEGLLLLPVPPPPPTPSLPPAPPVLHAAPHNNNAPQHTCNVCGKTFNRSNNLDRHRRNTHGGNYKLKCKVCGKPTEDKGMLRRHMATHTTREMEIPVTLRSLTGLVGGLMLDVHACLREARRLYPDCKESMCDIPLRASRNSGGGADLAVADGSAFRCFTCGRGVHWECAGYPKKHFDIGLGIIVCPPCLEKSKPPLPPHACLVAYANARMLFDYVQTMLGKMLVHVPADGLCMPTSVLTVLTSEGADLGDLTPLKLLRGALGMMPLLKEKSEGVTQDVVDEAALFLGYSDQVLEKKVSTIWASDVFDYLPDLMSLYLRRPIVVYSCLDLTVNAAPPARYEGFVDNEKPLWLATTLAELGVAHYSAIV